MDLQCLQNTFENTFLLDSLIYLLAPIALAIVLFISAVIYRACDRKHRGEGWRNVLRKAGNTATGTNILIMFLLQPILVERCALVVSCVQMGTDSIHYFMTEDLSIQCWGPTHWLYVSTLGLAFLLLYVIGIPLFLYYQLTTKKALVKIMINIQTNPDGSS